MTKWHGFGRCKTRLSKDIGKSNSAKVQSAMTKHTISVAKFLQKNKLIDISLAITGLGARNCRRWSEELGIKKFNLQGKGCLGEKMKRQIIINKKFCARNKIKNIIFIGTDLPDLCHQDLLNTLKELQKNDLVIGPSNDGGYWLIGLSEKIISSHIYLPFINIEWGTENVLQNTIDNFASTKLKYKFLDIKIDLDTIIDIENIK
jgi:rSAM/selenodomain-associated transferase 1